MRQSHQPRCHHILNQVRACLIIKSNHVIDVIGLTEDLDADHDGEPDEDKGDLEEARNGLVLLALKDLKDDDVQDGAAGNA